MEPQQINPTVEQSSFQPVEKHFSKTKLAAIILFLGAIPVIAFFLGMRYAETVTLVEQESGEVVPVETVNNDSINDTQLTQDEAGTTTPVGDESMIGNDAAAPNEAEASVTTDVSEVLE